jgi:hypothetical protein
VLLVRLDRPRVVEDVRVVHHDRLLDPLAAGEVPVRQAVDDQVVLHRLAQVERLDRDALDLEAQRVAARRDPQVEPRSRFS